MDWTSKLFFITTKTKHPGHLKKYFSHVLLAIGVCCLFIVSDGVELKITNKNVSHRTVFDNVITSNQNFSTSTNKKSEYKQSNFQSVINVNNDKNNHSLVKRNVHHNSHYYKSKNDSSTASSDSMRVFKYINNYNNKSPQDSSKKLISSGNNNNVNSSKLSSKASEVLTETSTVWDRSLIPNSFFSVTNNNNNNGNNNNRNESVSKSKNENKNIKLKSSSTTSASRGQKDNNSVDDLTANSSSERLRRSPHHRNVQRAALHRPPPRPLPRFRPIPQSHMTNHNYHSPPPPPPPNAIPVPLPYTQNQSPDYTGYGYGYDSEPEEQAYNYNRVKRPPHPSVVRRMPPSYRGQRPVIAPVPRPPNRQRHPGQPVFIRVKPPLYSYPKNAANIQDILTYFKDNENEIPQHYDPVLRPPSQTAQSIKPPVRQGSDFSKELDDVQSSLLKDIREFAKRPTFMGQPDPPTQQPKPQQHSPPTYKPPPTYQSPPTYKPSPTYQIDEPEATYEPQPKPVRDLVKEQPKPHRHHETNEGYGKHRHKGSIYRAKDPDLSYEDNYQNRDNYRDRDNYQDGYRHHRHESEEKLRYRGRDPGSAESIYVDKNVRNTHRPKFANSNKREKYNKNPYDESSEEWERYQERDRTQPSASAFTSTTKPIVLKRPYGPYRPETPTSLDMKSARAPYYNSWGSSAEKDLFPTVPRVKAPIITYHPSSRPSSSSKGNKPITYYKNMSPEIIEDIVEIHTDSPYRVDMDGIREREREEREREKRQREEKERKAHLQKLYLEYLEQKLEAERIAALATELPPTIPNYPKKHNPMRMKIHIYPNENVKIGEPTPMTSNYYYPSATSGYSNNNPAIVSVPTREIKYTSQNYLGSHSHRVGVSGSSSSSFGHTSPTGPQMGVDKNKNVVLHLHVHRRQGLGGMNAEASEMYTSTAKPLTYKDIYDEYQNHQNHKHSSHKGSSMDNLDDKSLSMELPIQDEKIDDVLHTLLQLRQQKKMH